MDDERNAELSNQGREKDMKAKPTPRGRRLRSGDLFSGGCQQLSPRLAWLKNHRVKTHEFTETPGDLNTYNHCGFGRWLAYIGRMPNHEDDGTWAVGDTEDAALVNMAKCMGWKIWNEELASTAPLNAKPLNEKLSESPASEKPTPMTPSIKSDSPRLGVS